jgi:enoyl-CoA hydratase/carnithine racemase
MEFECIIYDKKENVAIVKLHRPKVLNAMNGQMWRDLQGALDDVTNDPQIKVLIITGEGRAFSTGADLKESKTRSLEAYGSSVSRSRPSRPSTASPWAADMNWRWPVIFASQPTKRKSARRKPR